MVDDDGDELVSFASVESRSDRRETEEKLFEVNGGGGV